MITAKQTEKAMRSILAQNNLRNNLVATALRLYKSGAIDPASFDNDCALPKLLLSEALRREAQQYEPLSDSYKNELRNLRHF